MLGLLKPMLSRRAIVAGGLSSGVLLLRPSLLLAVKAPDASAVDPQPYFANVKRALEALEKLGAPVAANDVRQIGGLARQNDAAAVSAAEEILGRYTLATLSVGPNDATHIVAGGAPRQLIEQGWRMFLVRVENPSAKTDSLLFSSRTGTIAELATAFGTMAQRPYLADVNKDPWIEKMCITSELHGATPVNHWGKEVRATALSGIPTEYQVVQIFSRDRGYRTADFGLDLILKSGNDAGKSSHREFEFDCLPSRTVTLGVLDVDSRGCVASLTIKDKLNRVYPPQAMRIAPDMFFHEQVYRGDGEMLRLPDDEYTIESKRGPEYLRGVQAVTIATIRQTTGFQRIGMTLMKISRCLLAASTWVGRRRETDR